MQSEMASFQISLISGRQKALLGIVQYVKITHSHFCKIVGYFIYTHPDQYYLVQQCFTAEMKEKAQLPKGVVSLK